MFKKVFETIFSKDSLNFILPILLVQLVILVGTYNLLRPHMRKSPCAVCGRANTQIKKSLWEYKTGFLKHKKIYYCKQHIKKAPQIVQKLPSTNDTIIKRYWLAAAGGFLFFISTAYSLALFNIPFTYMIAVPIIQFLLYFFKGMVSNFTIITLFVCFLAAPILFFYLWMNVESGNIKLKKE